MAGVEGRVALVTGAGNPDGIGFAAAKALAQSGASVAITSTTERIFERLAELPGGSERHAAWVEDLSTSAAADRLVTAVQGRFGRLDIVVNNAGNAQTGKRRVRAGVHEITDDEWATELRMSLDTSFYVSRAALGAMRDRRHGRIVNVSSVSGPLVAFDKGGAYGTAKAGMTGLTRSIALEYGRDGITANAVAPGWIDNGKGAPRLLEGGRNTPVGRAGHADEVAVVIAFLATDEASYVTGQVIVVDGGNIIQDFKGGADPGPKQA